MTIPTTDEEALAVFSKVGGPAYPSEWRMPDGVISSPGMTLLDWFAGQALVGAPQDLPSSMAKRAYAVAAEMLAARAKAMETQS